MFNDPVGFQPRRLRPESHWQSKQEWLPFSLLLFDLSVNGAGSIVQ
jgi:hypothetical protein